MKEIKSKKSFLTLLITTCLILATTTFVPNIPADDESCINNLNAIFLSNAEEPMEVQATRLVNDELNTAAENWTLAELNEFLEDLEEDEDDQGEDEDDQGEDEKLEFKPGYLSADQTFTAMVSYGFIPEGSRDLEAYRELYHDPYSLEGNVSLSRTFQVLKQYDFIPSSISQSDFRKLGRTGLTIRGFEYPIPGPANLPIDELILIVEEQFEEEMELMLTIDMENGYDALLMPASGEERYIEAVVSGFDVVINEIYLDGVEIEILDEVVLWQSNLSVIELAPIINQTIYVIGAGGESTSGTLSLVTGPLFVRVRHAWIKGYNIFWQTLWKNNGRGIFFGFLNDRIIKVFDISYYTLGWGWWKIGWRHESDIDDGTGLIETFLDCRSPIQRFNSYVVIAQYPDGSWDHDEDGWDVPL